MVRRPPRTKRSDRLFPDTPLCRSQLEGTALQIGRGGTGSLTIRNGASFSMTDPFAAPGTALLKGETAHVGRESTGSGTLHLDNGSFTIDSVGTNLQVGRDSGDGTVKIGTAHV